MVATAGAGWDSVHVFEAVDHTRTASYKLTSTVMLHMTTSTPSLGSMNLSGNLTRQVRPLHDNPYCVLDGSESIG